MTKRAAESAPGPENDGEGSGEIVIYHSPLGGAASAATAGKQALADLRQKLAKLELENKPKQRPYQWNGDYKVDFFQLKRRESLEFVKAIISTNNLQQVVDRLLELWKYCDQPGTLKHLLLLQMLNEIDTDERLEMLEAELKHWEPYYQKGTQRHAEFKRLVEISRTYGCAGLPRADLRCRKKNKKTNHMLCNNCAKILKEYIGDKRYNEQYLDPYTFNPIRGTIDTSESFDPNDPVRIDDYALIDHNALQYDYDQ